MNQVRNPDKRQSVVKVPKVQPRTALAAGISVDEQWAGELGESATVTWDSYPETLPEEVYDVIYAMVAGSVPRMQGVQFTGRYYTINYFVSSGGHDEGGDIIPELEVE